MSKVLNVKAEVNHITIFNNVFFTFKTPFTGVFRTLFAVKLDKVVVTYDFSANKALFKVGVMSAASMSAFLESRAGIRPSQS